MSKVFTLDILSELVLDTSFYKQINEDGFTVEITLKSVTTHNNTIGDLHLNRFSSFCNQFKLANPENSSRVGSIKIIFSNEIINFDIGLVSLIAIFKQNFSNIEFELTFPQNASTDVFLRFRDVLFSLRSWYQSLNGINLYSIKYENQVDTEKIKEPEGVLPIILITPRTFHDFFVKNNSCFDLDMLFETIDSKEILTELEINLSLTYPSTTNFATKNYRAIRDTIRNFQKQINWKNNHRIFFHQYLRMISEFDLLPEQILFLKQPNGNPIKLDSFKKRGLKEIEMSKLKQEVREIILKLKSQPPILTLIFSVLVNRNLEKTIEDIDKYIVRLNELFEFSRNLFLGVRELARNIIEHTDSRVGVFSGRIYSGDTISQLKGVEKGKSNSTIMDNYFSLLESKEYLTKEIENEYFFDLVIFDEGQKGIIKKTIENIEFLTGNSSEEDNIYVSDVKALRSGEIIFKDFYNSSEIKLNHHAIKASSHWGLVIFTNLINKNNGLFIATTYADNEKQEFDSCYKFDDSINTPTRTDSFFEVGSFYNIILPLDKNFNLKDEYVANTVPKEPNFSEKNFIELLNYKYEKEIKKFKNGGKHTLLQIKVQKYLPENLVDEYRIENNIAFKVADYLKQVESNQKKFIPVLDFDSCEETFDQSKLFRFLAELEKQIDIYSIIIINIKQEVVKDLFKTLTEAFPVNKNDSNEIYRKAFWNKDHFILIYSYELNDAGARIYFTDILGGVSYYDFFLLNKKISSTHFTYPKFSDKIETGNFSEPTKEGLNHCPLYISESGIVQNFEMIIEHNEKSLFEHSIEFILNQEI
ncbi:MAG: hypothetical protein IPG12_04880 [Saprospiraceae bacterium]|nr:hypothetical protein [Saprospiraceae bacterium]